MIGVFKKLQCLTGDHLGLLPLSYSEPSSSLDKSV